MAESATRLWAFTGALRQAQGPPRSKASLSEIVEGLHRPFPEPVEGRLTARSLSLSKGRSHPPAERVERRHWYRNRVIEPTLPGMYDVCAVYIQRIAADGSREVLLGRKKTGLGIGHFVAPGGSSSRGSPRRTPRCARSKKRSA